MQIQKNTKEGLPSWVPDFETRQSATSFTLAIYCSIFKAAPKKWPNLRFEEGHVLVLQGVYVAIVVETMLVGMGIDPSKENENQMSRFKYDCESKKRDKEFKRSTRSLMRKKDKDVNFMNTSWGPMWMEIGDIIVVAKGS